MHGQDGADGCALWAVQNPLDGGRVQIECVGVDVGQQCGGSGAEDGADRGEEAERGGDHGYAGADAGGGQCQPQRVGARGAAQRVGHAQMLLGGALKGGYRLAQDKLLPLKHLLDRFQQLPVEWQVLAFEVQHRHRLRRFGRIPVRTRGRGKHVFHPTMLPARRMLRPTAEHRRLERGRGPK